MILSADEIKRYKDAGLIFPQRVMTTDDAANYLAELEAYETNSGGPINGKWRYKSHLVFPWFDQLMRHPAILELVRPILGDDLMVWTTHIYPKESGDGRFISWHQDSAHWGLDSNQVLTVWVALTNATRENGCMRMLPGSHHNGQVEHQDTRDPKNILTRGQTILNGIDEDQSVWVELKAGEASIHHVDLFHASTPNRAGHRRVGVAIRYITPAARQTRIDVDYATLVSGEDRFGHFKEEIAPVSTMSSDAIAFHEHVADLQGQIYLTDTDRNSIAGLQDPQRSDANS